MNEKIKQLRFQVPLNMHLRNLEDLRAMEGCFGQDGGNKIVNEYIEKFAELLIDECVQFINDEADRLDEYRRSLSEQDEEKRYDCDMAIEKCIDLAIRLPKRFGFNDE